MFPDTGYLPPSLTFAESLDVEVGGLTLHLEHTEGESHDHALVWVPELKALFPGDQIFDAFPNLATPAMGPRPVDRWITSLERCLALEPDHLVPSHGPSVSGQDRVRNVLTTYRDCMQYIWTSALEAIDRGVDVAVAARTISLPRPMADHPWLRPLYGTANWGVRAVYGLVTGWYDLWPSSLDPVPRPILYAALCEAAGVDAIVERADAALAAGNAHLALELVEVVLVASPLDPRAVHIEEAACAALVDAAVSATEKGFYLSALRIARGRSLGEGHETREWGGGGHP